MVWIRDGLESHIEAELPQTGRSLRISNQYSDDWSIQLLQGSTERDFDDPPPSYRMGRKNARIRSDGSGVADSEATPGNDDVQQGSHRLRMQDTESPPPVWSPIR